MKKSDPWTYVVFMVIIFVFSVIVLSDRIDVDQKIWTSSNPTEYKVTTDVTTQNWLFGKNVYHYHNAKYFNSVDSAQLYKQSELVKAEDLKIKLQKLLD